MARAQLLLSAELERAFADAQGGGVRYVKASIEGETFALASVGAASADVRADAAHVATSELVPTSAAFVFFCLDVNAPALRWVLLAFVPEAVSVRDKMLYSSSRESLKKQLGNNYFVGEFHATDVVRLIDCVRLASENKRSQWHSSVEWVCMCVCGTRAK